MQPCKFTVECCELVIHRNKAAEMFWVRLFTTHGSYVSSKDTTSITSVIHPAIKVDNGDNTAQETHTTTVGWA